MRLRLAARLRPGFSVRALCRVLKVSRSGLYALLQRGECQKAREDRRLEVEIRALHRSSRGTYGSPRIHHELQERVFGVGRKRVARLMSQIGLRSKRQRKFRVTTDSKHRHPVAPNRLARRFEVQALDAVWLSDITYLWTEEGWLYLAVVLDLGSRRIVGWSTSARLEQDLTLAALEQALYARQPARRLLHHSDRGSQSAAKEYQKRLREAGLEVSMSGKGDCWDNAPMESFFATLKTECVVHRRYASRAEERRDVFEFIESFYNTQRRHSALGYLSPAEFERRSRERENGHGSQRVLTARKAGVWNAGDCDLQRSVA